MTNPLFPILCMIVGALCGWIVSRLIISKRYVGVDDFKRTKEELQLTKTEKAVLDNSFQLLKDRLNRLEEEIRTKEYELSKVGNEYTKAETERSSLREDLNEQINVISKLEEELESKRELLINSNNTVTRLEAVVEYKDKELKEQGKNLEDIGKKFEKEFSNLAQKILDEKSSTFGTQQENNLKLLLEPFKADIINFKKEFSEKHTQEAAERNSLKGAISEIVKQNQVLSEQANNLSKALTFQSKQQGSWGEEILESILEHCGLQKNIHYFKQFSSNNEQGARIRPDFVVKCPDNRSIVIDSKVSLSHYTSYCSTALNTEQETFAKALLLSIKNHIDSLSTKSYADIADSLDHVIMFMPVESAYIVAMQMDSDLWRYAYSKKILLISPSNLIATIKLISDLWQRDAINKNAKAIAEKAGRLYDKIVSFVDNMKKVGENIAKANDTWRDAYGQLCTGNGNMINQAEGIKKLGIKTQKKFSEALLNEAVLSDSYCSTEIVEGAVIE